MGEQQAKAAPLYVSWVDKVHAHNGWPTYIALLLILLHLSFTPGTVLGEVGLQYVLSVGIYVLSVGIFLICTGPLC